MYSHSVIPLKIIKSENLKFIHTFFVLCVNTTMPSILDLSSTIQDDAAQNFLTIPIQSLECVDHVLCD